MTPIDLEKSVPANPAVPDLSAENIIPGTSVTPDPNAVVAANNALDALFKEVSPPEPEPPAGAPAATNTPAVPAQPAAAPVVPASPAGTAPAAPAPAPAPAKDELDAVELPPYTKPKTAEQFATVKHIARERITSLSKERDDLAAKLQDAESKVGKLPQETEQELNELRIFRKQMDVQYDPSFKQFDTQTKTNEEAIFAKLKESGATDEVIAKARATGIDNIDWEAALPKLPKLAQRFIENKLVANEELRAQKAAALDEAKKNADKFLSDRENAGKQTEKEVSQRINTHFNELVTKLPWYGKKTASATATAEEKASIETHNKFMDTVGDAIKDAVDDNTPEMKAVLTLGYVQMLNAKRELAANIAGRTAEQASWAAEKAKLEAAIAEKDAFINKIKQSSSPSFRSAASPGVSAKPLTQESGNEALDRLRGETAAA